MEFNRHRTPSCSPVSLACQEGNYEKLKILLNSRNDVAVKDNRGWRPIHYAVAYNKVACLKLLIEHGKTDINWRSFEGETPLLLAMKHNYGEIVQLLLSNGANPNVGNNKKEYPLMIATKCDDLACMRTLLDHGANVNQHFLDGSTALHLAIKLDSNNLSIVEELAARGANLNAQDMYGITPVSLAALVGFLDGLKVLVQHAKETGRLQSILDFAAKDGATPIILATQNGEIDCVEYLLENGADGNKLTEFHESALHLAIQLGHSYCAQMLLDRMERSNWLPYMNLDSICACDCVIDSPLHDAIFWKQHDIVKHILNAGIDTNAVCGRLSSYLDEEVLFFRRHDEALRWILRHLPEFISALGVAALAGSIEVITDLLKAGAEINPKSEKVMCPLLLAIFAEREDVVEFLLSNGADPNCSGKGARKMFSTMLVLPVLKVEMLRLLLRYGADARPTICPCPYNHFMDCGVDAVRLIGYRATFYRTAAVFQEFRYPVELIKCVHTAYTKDEKSNLEDLQCWQTVFQASEIPASLADLCRKRIRKSVMDNGSELFPIQKRLDKLTELPATINRYLSLE